MTTNERALRASGTQRAFWVAGGWGASGLLLSALLACGTPPPPADEVARNFWQAIRVEDFETARACVSRDTLPLLRASALPRDLENILLGEVLMNERAAVVRTSLSTAQDPAPMELVFQTYLVLEDEQWKVDLEATREEVKRATVAAGMQMMSDIIVEGIDELGDALERGAGELGEAIREALEGPGERI